MVLRRALISVSILLLTPGPLLAQRPKLWRERVAASSPRRSAPQGREDRRAAVSSPSGRKVTARKPKKTRRARRKVRDVWPPFTLEHVNTHEKLTLRLYDRRGRTIRSSVRKIWRLMRCHHTGKQHAIHWRLLQRLYRVARHYKGKTLQIYSGYRSRRVARLRASKHTLGRAVDFAVSSVSTRSLRDYIKRTFTKNRGLGYYPNSPFVHFDVRDKAVLWVDYSGKGEEPRYAKNPYQVLDEERRARRQAKKAAHGKLARARPAKPTAAQQPALPPAGEDVFGPPAPPSAANTEPDPPVVCSARLPHRSTIPTPVEGPTPLGPGPLEPKAKSEAGTASAVPADAPSKEPAGPESNVRSVPP